MPVDLRCTRAAHGLASVPRTFVPEYRWHGPATHTRCASHLLAEMAEMLELECDCTPHCPHTPSAEYGGVVRKGCHLQESATHNWQSTYPIRQLPESVMDGLPTAQCRRKACPS